MRDRPLQSPVLPIKLRKIPLKYILIGQFAILIVGISGFTAWLSWRSEQETIANLVSQLQDEIGDHIEHKLTSYLETPYLINQINADAVKRGEISVESQKSELYFWRQMQYFPSVSWIYFGEAKQGRFLGGLVSDPERSTQIVVNLNGVLTFYRTLDNLGNRLVQKVKIEFFDARRRPWYQNAVKTNKPNWSEIYQDFGSSNLLFTASRAVYDESGELIGVVAVDFSLQNINRFLNNLKIGKSGQAFIIEPSGLLVASSTHETPYLFDRVSKKSKRLPLKNSRQPQVQSLALHLEQQYTNLDRIKTEQQLEFWWEGKRHFVKLQPFQDARGLNWVIIVMIPESDFMDQIYAKRQITFLLSFLALAGAIALGLLTTYYINKPLERLMCASKSLASGELDREVPSTQIAELDLLSQAFNQMASQLRQSFHELEESNQNLESRVKERTAELSASEELFSKIFSTSPYPISITSRSKKQIIKINESYLTYTGYVTEEIVGKKLEELPFWFDLQDLYVIAQLLDRHGSIRDLEVNYRKKSQEIGTCLLSAEVIELAGDICTIMIFNDFTDRKLVEADLKQSEALFSKIFWSSPYPISISSRSTRQVLKVNESYLSITGYTQEQLIGKKVEDLPVWIDPQDLYQISRLLDEHGSIRNFEINFRQRSKEIGTTLISIETLELNGEECSIAVFNDITDRKLAENALRRSEELFSKVFWAAPYPISISSRSTQRMIEVNQSYLDATGYSSEELIGKNVAEMPIWTNLQDLVLFSKLLDENGAFHNLELNYRKKSQEIGTILASAEIVELNGETCVLTLHNDITDRKLVEEALVVSEERFRTLVANTPGIVYRCACDADWTMEFIGGAVEEVTGYRAEDFVCNQVLSWASIIHPEEREMVERIVGEGLALKQSYIIEYRIFDIRGNIHWLYEKGQGIFGPDGSLQWLDGAIFDISDRKQIEADLLERVHLSIVMAEIGLASTQLETLQEMLVGCAESLWRHMNIAFAQIWTYDDSAQVLELQAKAGLYHLSDDTPSHLPVGQSETDAATNVLVSIARDRQPYLTDDLLADLAIPKEEWMLSEGIVSFAGYPLMVGDRFVGVMAIFARGAFTATTVKEMEPIANALAIGIDRKQAQIHIQAANAEMKALFAAMDQVIVVCDRHGRIPKILPTKRPLRFRHPSEVIGKTISEIFPPEQAARFLSFIQQTLETQQALNFEDNIPVAGQDNWWNLCTSSIDSDTVIMVAQNINERKQFEQQLDRAKQSAEAANQAKSSFLANMSHELRTPLNAILGFSQLMVRDISLQDSHRSYLKIIRESGEHLLELINDVLDMSKIEAGRTTLNATSFDLYHVLELLEKMFALKAQTKSLQLIFERSPTVPQWIFTDEGKLRQILINLLGNAIKFTKHGAVMLSVNAIHVLERDSSEFLNPDSISNPDSTIDLVFEVADTGEGIPIDELEQIFKPFQQTEIGKQATEGTGLGLPISRKFAEFMGGDISVSSNLHQGSIFKVQIPVIVTAVGARSPQVPETYVIHLAPNQPEYRILVVEDRLESRDLLVKLLETIGFAVREAANGAEAIAVWEEWQPHLIWMDMRMPVMDGYEATQRIKSHLKGQATVIIALTASALEEEKAIILSAGCDDFVRKPFREAIIFDKLSEYLGVKYLCKDEVDDNSGIGETSDSAISKSESDLSIHISSMPHAWIEQLAKAAMLADNDLIAELVKAIPSKNSTLANSLACLVDNFCYNQIMVLAQQALIKCN